MNTSGFEAFLPFKLLGLDWSELFLFFLPFLFSCVLPFQCWGCRWNFMFHRMPCSFHSNFLQLLIALSLVYLTTYFQENLARPKADVAEEKKEDTLQRREISQEDVQQTWRNIIQIQWVRNYSQHLLIHLWNKLLQFGFNFLNCFKLNIFSVVYTGFLICVLTLDSCISGISDPVLVLKCIFFFFFLCSSLLIVAVCPRLKCPQVVLLGGRSSQTALQLSRVFE